MQKITRKSRLLLYGCSGIGVNMLNLIVGTYLCSALIVEGFDPDDFGLWTYTDKTLVVAALWSILALTTKIIDGIIDVPMSPFIDNLKTRWGRRRPAILMGFVPMILMYLMFLLIPDNGATIKNTIWFACVTPDQRPNPELTTFIGTLVWFWSLVYRILCNCITCIDSSNHCHCQD